MQASMTILFQEVERLDNRSLDTFIANVVSLRARRTTPDKQKKEAFLLEKINKSLYSSRHFAFPISQSEARRR